MGEWRVVGENNKAYRAFKREDWGTAARMLERLAVEHADDRRAKVWAFDAALSYKFLRDWPRAYELGKVAASYVEREQQDPAFWNLGIAATVLREWPTARDAWAGYGIGMPVPDGDGPPVMDLGMTPVRRRRAGERFQDTVQDVQRRNRPSRPRGSSGRTPDRVAGRARG